jgi:carboxylesterase
MPTATIEKTKEKIDLEGVPFEARPFYFPAGKRGIFFIHGFTDSLCRVNGFAKFLAERGITTKGVLLPGHGYGWEELAETTPNDWYKEVERGILEFSKQVDEVYIIGISLGGNLALKFAAKYPDIVSGIVTIEAPMRIKNQYLTRAAIPFAQLFGMRYWNKKYLKKVKHPDKEKVFDQGVLDKMPLINIAQVIDFLENKQSFLSRVKCDVLIIQSDKSNLVVNNSAQKIYEAIGSKRKKIFRMENVYHAFVSEPAKRTIYYEAAKFFDIKV